MEVVWWTYAKESKLMERIHNIHMIEENENNHNDTTHFWIV